MSQEPKLTGYGWLIRLQNGELQEFATDQEALETVEEEKPKKEE